MYKRLLDNENQLLSGQNEASDVDDCRRYMKMTKTYRILQKSNLGSYHLDGSNKIHRDHAYTSTET